jgi:3-oxoadipate enol-lactonase
VGRIQISDGTSIGFAEAGGGPALPLILLHGVGSTKRVWQPQLDHFATQRRTVALDYPGYGESDPARDPSRDGFAAAMLAAMTALGIPRAHICGLSLGGVITIAMAHAAPQRCASLILADSFAVHPQGRAIYDRSVAASRDLGMRALAQQRSGALLAPGSDARLHDEVIETMASIDPDAYRIGAEAVWLADQQQRAAAITAPTLVLCGEADQVTTPDLSRELAALIPGAELELIGDAGHLANIERPAAFNAAVGEFIHRVEPG